MSSSPQVAYPSFTRTLGSRAVIDRAHIGDIDGAFGALRVHEPVEARSRRWRLRTLLAVMGPGVLVMVADNEAGSFSLYGQAGQNYGLSLLWLFVILAPVLFVLQEMAARLGAVTGVGHARLIYERFGRRWGVFALIDLLLLSVLTIVTEFIGVDLALQYFGVSRFVSVPATAVILVAATMTGSFRRWERVMYLLLACNLLFLPLAIVAHPSVGGMSRGLIPGLSPMHLGAGGLLFVVAIVGGAASPWQLFFQQSNVIDKRITTPLLSFERADTMIGTVLFTLGAIAVTTVCAIAFNGSALHGRFVNTGSVAQGIDGRLGSVVATLFALALFNASVLGSAVMALGTSYAIGDVFNLRHSLHRPWAEARVFYGSYVVLIVTAAAVVLIPDAPLGVITVATQAVAGVLLPSAAVFLLLLCNDRAVLGPWTNTRRLNAVATLIISLLLLLSAVLTIETLDPAALTVVRDLGQSPILLIGASIAVAVILTVGTRFCLVRHRPSEPRFTERERRTWMMPALDSLPRPARSAGRTAGLLVLRLYVACTFALVVVKSVELIVN
jgi:Mn2+/Fe2+ NRAMP family transporter